MWQANTQKHNLKYNHTKAITSLLPFIQNCVQFISQEDYPTTQNNFTWANIPPYPPNTMHPPDKPNNGKFSPQ